LTVVKHNACSCLLLAAALSSAHAATATKPRPTPHLYVTGNHGVRIEVPGGLYYCPLPDSWVGADHGSNLFLTPPSDCDAEAAPRVSVYYGLNVAEWDHGDGQERPPRTDAELRQDECPRGGGKLTDLRLLGRSVTGCTVQKGALVTISANVLYSLEHGGIGSGEPDHILAVTLFTTSERLEADVVTFRRVLAGTSICTPEWAQTKVGRQACQEHSGSWW
jgi:hypothetical protein